MKLSIRLRAIALPLALAAPAHAAVVISTAATQNMSCSNGVCAPTASNGVLNVTDLENMLAAGNIDVTTTGAGVQANDIQITGAFSWSIASSLTLDAYRSVLFEQPVAVAGSGGVSLTTNDGGSGGTLSFGRPGNLTFQNLSSALTIDGIAYTLENSVKSLSKAISANPAGFYALAANYNASKDGTFTETPIGTALTGTVEGLGNDISNLTVRTIRVVSVGGLFAEIAEGGAVSNLGLTNAAINANEQHAGGRLGGLVAVNDGDLFNDHIDGVVNASGGWVGTLASQNQGTVSNCYATGSVSIRSGVAGGLVGVNGFSNGQGSVSSSYSTAAVSGYYGGGLIGGNYGPISNSYARGSVKPNQDSPAIGGLISASEGGAITNSYSTGAVSKHRGGDVGGFIGYVDAGSVSDDYWDTTTSSADNGTGNDGNVSGLTGLTSTQLKSGLPAGFDPSIWSEAKGINDGFPYLIANPPPH